MCQPDTTTRLHPHIERYPWCSALSSLRYSQARTLSQFFRQRMNPVRRGCLESRSRREEYWVECRCPSKLEWLSVVWSRATRQLLVDRRHAFAPIQSPHRCRPPPPGPGKDSDSPYRFLALAHPWVGLSQVFTQRENQLVLRLGGTDRFCEPPDYESLSPWRRSADVIGPSFTAASRSLAFCTLHPLSSTSSYRVSRLFGCEGFSLWKFSSRH